MLQANEAADIPVELATQRTIASLGLDIKQYAKTLQGRNMIMSQELFVLNGRLYQGYEQVAIEVNEVQCMESEIEKAHDVDGSKAGVLATRAARLGASKIAKEREQRDNQRKKIAQQRDELELRKLQREEAAYALTEADPEADPETDPEPVVHACPTCGKVFPAANKLNAHKMGAKH